MKMGPDRCSRNVSKELNLIQKRTFLLSHNTSEYKRDLKDK